jgi:hypothetical protein
LRRALSGDDDDEKYVCESGTEEKVWSCPEMGMRASAKMLVMMMTVGVVLVAATTTMKREVQLVLSHFDERGSERVHSPSVHSNQYCCAKHASC